MIAHISPVGGFVAAAVFWAGGRVASVVGAPNWLENGALVGFVGCLVFAISVLWKRNNALGDQINEITRELKDEMQAQIESERASRDRLIGVLEKLDRTTDRVAQTVDDTSEGGG